MMCGSLVKIYFILVCSVLFLSTSFSPAYSDDSSQLETSPPASEEPAAPPAPELPVGEPEQLDVLEATIINPFRSANVGADVGGILERCPFEEGDFVAEGQVVAEISKTRYTLQTEKAEEAVRSFEAAFRHAENQVKLMHELLARDATSRQDVLKAESERDLAYSRFIQARKDFELAALTLRDCQVRAPFPGYLAFRYKQPYEPVERLEKIFTLIDTSKVYAVANISENLISQFVKESPATFVHSSGKSYTGKVDRVGKVIDVKSKTKRVYVLLDNSRGELEVGMTGSLRPSPLDTK